MNTLQRSPRTLVMAVSTVCLAACAANLVQPEGVADLRSRLTTLQSDTELARHIPLALLEAEVAVAAAERPQLDAAAAEHLVFMADRRIEIARALGVTRLAEEERKALEERSEGAQRKAREHSGIEDPTPRERSQPMVTGSERLPRP